MSNTKKEHLSQIKSDKSKEMDADKYIKHSFSWYRDEPTIPNILSPAMRDLIHPEMLVYFISE